jgi:hypothetical protein
MWLSGMSRPDHNTINRFRGVRLKGSLREVFNQVVILLNQEGLLSIDEVYTDGTKIEANAGKYTFVWKKSIQTNKLKMKQQLQDIWDYASVIAKKEDEELPPEPPTSKELNKENLEAAVERINEVLGSSKKWIRNNEQNCCTSRKTLAKTWRNTTNKKKYWVSVIVIARRIRMRLLCA